MCYYSRTMKSSEFRDAVDQENLIIDEDRTGHAVALARSDNKIVCVTGGKKIHFENFQVDLRLLPLLLQPVVSEFVGKPLSTTFVEYQGLGMASDCVLVGGSKIHIYWLRRGIRCYVGTKKVAKLETKLGVDEQTLKGAALDHREPDTIVDRVLAPREYVNAIVR